MSRKEFEIKEDNGKNIKLAIRVPQYEDLEEADRVYAGTVASLVRDRGNRKLLLRKEVEEHIRKYGIWTEEDDKTIDKLNKEINDILNKIRKGGEKLSTGRDLCIQVMDKRIDIVELSKKKQVLYDTTIESIAETEKIDYMIYICTVYADSGKNYWQSFEDMKNDKASEAYSKAVPHVMDAVFGLNNEFEKRLPENRWLKKYGFLDDELHYTDRKTGKKVTKEGKPVEEAENAAVQYVLNLQGEIKEEQPFLDDETNEPVVIKENKEENKIEEKEKDVKKEKVETAK